MTLCPIMILVNVMKKDNMPYGTACLEQNCGMYYRCKNTKVELVTLP